MEPIEHPPSQTLTIRAARPEDAAILTDLTLRSKAHWGYDAQFMDDVRSEMVVRPEQIERDWIYVLEAAGKICGYYDLEKRDDGMIWLESLFIAPDAMGQGIGRRLWDHAVQSARTLGFSRLEFESDPNAEGFYLKMGAVRISEQPKPINGQPDRVLPRMRLVLTNGA
jgi:GNAT superfamily N-acetyltransferase